MNKIICLMGPTAAGKTSLAIALRQQLPCEIISVDSGMVYRGMDIGTAKPTIKEQQIAPHRLIDICDPKDSYSAARFRSDALREIKDIIKHQRIPLLVGGTMLYFKALQEGLSDLPGADATIRAELQKQELPVLYQRLKKIDPLTARRLKPGDKQRIQRALEVYLITGKTLSALLAAHSPEPLAYQVINIAIAPESRTFLHQRIKERFIKMLELGFIAEVEALYKRGDLNLDLPAMRAVGYRQVWQYLAGKLTYDAMQDRAIIATRQLAKRQLTWLRSWPALEWFYDSNVRRVYEFISRRVNY